MERKRYITLLCTLLLLLLWIPVALDKLWDLEGFRGILLRQPFSNAWAGVLYWLLPAAELVCALLLVGGAMDNPKTNLLRKWGFALSSLLLLGFTLFILFGVLGWYEKRPCGCGSVISGRNWEQHLWFNFGFLLISVLGWWMMHRWDDHPSTGFGEKVRSGLTDLEKRMLHSSLLMFYGKGMGSFSSVSLEFRYPRKFALFPGRLVTGQDGPPDALDSMGAASRMGCRGPHTMATLRQKRSHQKKNAPGFAKTRDENLKIELKFFEANFF